MELPHDIQSRTRGVWARNEGERIEIEHKILKIHKESGNK